MSVSEILKEAEQKMKGAIDAMTHDFSSYRTGRASPAVLDRVHVLYYGNEVPMNQVANISVPEPRQLLIQPWEKSMTPVIEKAIMKSDLGINPVNDGTGIRLNFPQMTEDRRKDMVKQVHARTENGRVSIRNVRREAIDHLKALEKKKEITEDDVKGYETKIQKLTDQFIAQADDLGKKKEAELMQV
ncbi:ribosome recycling factor [Fimbriimonas ginsengisoli]|uniref:Ribosome-recycling factor n=1 Tax=Fimbriimonas ginsengisoli Gsoil 348 TaxID=661478 RepID=A0A068NUT1_FIMGI|nr:ribosome recycling factor [Fimbriimonas ginsengisoli]AIE87092.1 ribosome recycling factor [Fimbriimonas ginsengisoli Gsoil 348]